MKHNEPDYLVEEKAAARDFGHTLGKFVNGYSRCQFDVVAISVAQEHRTIQQLIIGLCMKIIFKVAECGTDMRNDAAVSLCKKIKKENEEYFLPFI